MTPSWHRLAALAGSMLLLGGAIGVGYWAGLNAVAPPSLPADEHPSTTYSVAVGTVSRSLNVSITAGWAVTHTLGAGSSGMVTSIVQQPGASAHAGDVIGTIDLEPVVLAQGSVPMFRTLKRGVTGTDVAQLQALLSAEGFLQQRPHGRFGRATEVAVERWQGAIGAVVDGIVDAGDLLFVDELPVRAEVVTAVGTRISAGEPFLRLFADRPAFVAIVSSSQRPDLTTGMSVKVAGPGGESWPGTLGAFEVREDGRYEAALTGGLCGSACDTIGFAGQTALSGSIELVPMTSGVVVPTSALVLLPSGRLSVTLADGSSAPVEVTAEADGFAVVDGLDPGVVIMLPAPR